MIIDIILDRREGAIDYTAAAVDGGAEDDVKAALMDYVISGGCNPDIHHHNFLDLCLFIKSVRSLLSKNQRVTIVSYNSKNKLTTR